MNFKIFTRAQLAVGVDSRCWLHFKVSMSDQRQCRKHGNYQFPLKSWRRSALSTCKFVEQFSLISNLLPPPRVLHTIHNSFEFIALISFFSRVFPHRLHPWIKVKVFVFLLLITINEVMIAINFILRVDWWWERPASWSWKIEAIYWNHCDRVWEKKEKCFSSSTDFSTFPSNGKVLLSSISFTFHNFIVHFSLLHLKTGENWLKV